jgi:serine/threonine protein kinase
MTDKLFFEQYRYDPEHDLLGCGGFGNVYRAYDYSGKRYVAIKISQVKDIFGKFTLLNEVELSKGIDDHANVARYEFGLRVKLPFPVDYAIMAYYEEGNLDMVLRKKFGQLTDREYYEIVEGLLEGIGHLHTENVIHRDLKLANILMHRTKQGQWRPKIADFGLSRQISDYDASIANSAIGITIAYAAPEQIENKPIRKNVDLWALGVIVYRLLTGEMPFAAAQGADATSANLEMSRKITSVELPERLNTLPEPYQTIIRRCFVKDTKDRAQSVVELLEVLKKFKPDSPSRRESFLTTVTTTSEKSAPQLGEKSLNPIVFPPPSVSKSFSGQKPIEIQEKEIESAQPVSLGTLEALVSEGETVIDPSSIPNAIPQNLASEGETVIDPSSLPKVALQNMSSEGETVIDPSSLPKVAPQNMMSEGETVIDPSSLPKATPQNRGNEAATVIEQPSMPKVVFKNPINEAATLIEQPSTPQLKDEDVTQIEVKPAAGKGSKTTNTTPISEQLRSKKGKMLVGGGVLALLLSFGICQKSNPDSAPAVAATTAPTSEVTNSQQTNTSVVVVTPTPSTPSIPASSSQNASVPTTVEAAKPKVDAKTGKVVPQTPIAQPVINQQYTPTPEPAQPHYQQEDLAEKRRKEEEENRKRQEDEKRKRDEEDAKKRAEAARIKAAEDAERQKNEEAANKEPDVVKSPNNILDEVKCRGCCKQMTHGTITINNFTVDANGRVLLINTTVTIVNQSGIIDEKNGCREGILKAFKDTYKFSVPKNGKYEFNRYRISY